MKNLSSIKELNKSIYSLSQLQETQGELLKEQFKETVENIRPENIVKEAVNAVIHSPDLAKNIISTSLGVTTGVFAKKIFIAGSGNIFRKLIGSMVQFGVTAAIATNPDLVKSAGTKIINRVFHKNL